MKQSKLLKYVKDNKHKLLCSLISSVTSNTISQTSIAFVTIDISCINTAIVIFIFDKLSANLFTTLDELSKEDRNNGTKHISNLM